MNLLNRLRGQRVAASRLRAALPGLAAALACAVLAGPVTAQSLSNPGVTPGKATTNSIYNHTITWTWTPSTVNSIHRMDFSATWMKLPSSLPPSGTTSRSSGEKSF